MCVVTPGLGSIRRAVFEDSAVAYLLSVEVHGCSTLRGCQGGKLSEVRFLHWSFHVVRGMYAAGVM